ncbi:hypothetical protein Pcinc_010196 [Petrolisthes cinctipes]|uniref:PiggyBac transposable element-derived protein domain-containing protein n=1 Tax=Petrolisthes cinctipes TaxID=88211 RepID=A0AAE1G5C5_PETCI|nr:hypothetical protein Pcinc_010196 [Petrolisthes cinctipes]
MRTPVASSLTSNQLHPSSSSTSITLPKQSTSTQGQLPCKGRDAQVDSPVTPRHTNGKKASRSTHIPPSSFTTTESVPIPAVPGPSTSRHASTQRSHPHQHNLTSSTTKILPLLFLEDEDSASETDIISRDEVWLDDSAHSSSSDEDEENENYETAVNLCEAFSFSWSKGSDFVPDQHDFQPNSSGTTRDWPCNDEARESDFFCAFIDKEVMSYIAEKTNRYYSWMSQHMEFISPGSRRQRTFVAPPVGEDNSDVEVEDEFLDDSDMDPDYVVEENLIPTASGSVTRIQPEEMPEEDEDEDDEEEDKAPPRQKARQTEPRRVWKKEGISHPPLPEYHHPVPELLQQPYEFFMRMFPKELLEDIFYQTNLYAHQKDVSITFSIDIEDLMVFMGIVLTWG